MKNKILKTIFIIVVTVLFIPTNAKALSFKDGKTTYVLEEREISCLKDYIVLQGTDKDNNLVFSKPEDRLDAIKVNDKNECLEMTIQEKIDFINLQESYYRVMGGTIYPDEPEEDYGIYEQKMTTRVSGLVKTNDKKIVEGKIYNILISDAEAHSVLEPKKEELNTYYEEKYFELAKTTKIDNNVTYYELKGLKFEKIENPKEENILDYYIISNNQNNEEEYIKIVDLNKEIFEPLFEEAYLKETIKLKDKEEFYVLVGTLVEHTELGPIITFDVYKTDGTKIRELEGIDYIDTYHNSLIGAFKDGLKIYNSNLEVIYENKDLENLREVGYNNYTYYMSSLDREEVEETFYNMYEYKLLEGDNQTYNNKDLTLKFSGRLEKLTNVLVNDKELEESNYKLESGSTIITLNKDYLSKLAKGTYTLTLEYENGGEASANFIIPEPNPQTYDGITTYFIVGITSIIGLVVLAIVFKKQVKN